MAAVLPPGPRTPAFWQTYRFVFDPHAYARQVRAKYGDALRFRAFIGEGIAVFDPALAKEVFAAPPEAVATSPMLESLFGPNAVIAVSGEPHKRLRKLLNPPFHGAQVKGFLAAMQRAIRAGLGRFEAAAQTGEILVLTDVTQSLALDVIIETIFGEDRFDRLEARRVLSGIIRAFSPILAGGTVLHKRWFPPYRRLVARRADFDRWVDRLLEARQASGAKKRDVLGVLLDARYEDGAPMTAPELRDQLVTLLLAGHETSAIAIAWAVYWLLETPPALARLRGEVDALGDDPPPEALVKLEYLDAIVCETLRIEPIVTDVVRVCRAPFRLGPWRLEPGHVMAVMVGSILRDGRVYDRPTEFRPERFLDKRFAPTEFLPFGGGARRCLGAAFAQSELMIAVAEIAARWELAYAGNAPERGVRKNITMGPKSGVRIRVRGKRTRAPRG